MKKKKLLKRIKALEAKVLELQFLKCTWTFCGYPISNGAAWELHQQQQEQRMEKTND